MNAAGWKLGFGPDNEAAKDRLFIDEPGVADMNKKKVNTVRSRICLHA